MSSLVSLQDELSQLRDSFDRRVTERVRLILRAGQVAPNAVFDAGASDIEIMAKAVAAVSGPEAIDGKPDTYIEARFDHLSEQAPVDPVRLALAYHVDRRH